MGWFKKFRKFLKQAAPIITAVVLIVAPELALAIGESMGATGAAAQAAGAAVISGTSTAVGGGSVEDVAKSAALAGGGSYVGSMAGSSAGEAAKSAGLSDTTAKVISAGAGSGASTTAQSLATGADLEESLKRGAAGAVAGAGTEGIVQALKEPTQPGIRIPASGRPEDVPQVGLSTQPLARSDYVSTGDSTGLIMPGYTRTTSPTQLASYDLSDVSPQARTQTVSRPYTDSYVGSFGEGVIKELVPSQLYQYGYGLFGTDQPSSNLGQARMGAETTGTPSYAALSQALRIGDPGDPLLGTEKGGKRKNVWNVESLKLTDEMGA